MPKKRIADRSAVKVNAGLSLTQHQIDLLNADAQKYGFKSRSELLQAFIDQQYPAFLWNLELEKNK